MVNEPRIISLIPSATEIVAALGMADRLVARSHECDFPQEVTSLPIVSKPRIELHGSSRHIDEEVRATVSQGLSIYLIDEDLLESLHPSVIITQHQCEVCAVNLRDVEVAVGRLLQSQPKIVSLLPMKLSDIWSDIEKVADALGCTEAGRNLVARLQSELHRVASLARLPSKPRVLCIEWIEPFMVAGNWIPELVEIAGGIPLLAEAGRHSPFIPWEEALAADPDLIVIMPCGFDIPRSDREFHLLAEQRGWSEMRAVQAGKVYLTDGNQYFNRPGPRIVESANILRDIIEGHRDTGEGWKRASLNN